MCELLSYSRQHLGPFSPWKVNIELHALVNFLTHNKLHLVLKDSFTSTILTDDVAWCCHKPTKRSRIRHHLSVYVYFCIGRYFVQVSSLLYHTFPRINWIIIIIIIICIIGTLSTKQPSSYCMELGKRSLAVKNFLARFLITHLPLTICIYHISDLRALMNPKELHPLLYSISLHNIHIEKYLPLTLLN